MMWMKAGKGLYHLHIGGGYICGARLNFDDHHQVNSSDDPPGDERCKNCMRLIDHIHHSTHTHNGYMTDPVVYRFGKWPMIFTRKLTICEGFGKIERTFTNVWIQQTGEVREGDLLRDAIGVYSIHTRGYIDTDTVAVINLGGNRYYKFE